MVVFSKTHSADTLQYTLPVPEEDARSDYEAPPESFDTWMRRTLVRPAPSLCLYPPYTAT